MLNSIGRGRDLVSALQLCTFFLGIDKYRYFHSNQDEMYRQITRYFELHEQL